MEEYIVPNLYNDLNLDILPKIILEEFKKVTGKLSGFKDPFGKPYCNVFNFKSDNEKINFYSHFRQTTYFHNLLEKKILLNEEFQFLEITELHEVYFKQYAKGFYKGYTVFAKELKNKENEVFELDNTQIVHKVISKAIFKGTFRRIDTFPKFFIPPDARKKFNLDVETYPELHYLKKDSFFEAGFKSGGRYKAWELILHNPTLFEESFAKHFANEENEKQSIKEEPVLKRKGIPKFNLQQRYSLFEQLGFDSVIHTLNTKEKSPKHKILAIILGISPDSAKHLMNGSYTPLTSEHQEDLEEFLYRNKIKL